MPDRSSLWWRPSQLWRVTRRKFRSKRGLHQVHISNKPAAKTSSVRSIVIGIALFSVLTLGLTLGLALGLLQKSGTEVEVGSGMDETGEFESGSGLIG